MKFYAVKVGLRPGIYTSWSEAQVQINGYSGAVFKSFKTQEAAKAYLNGEENVSVNTQNVDYSFGKKSSKKNSTVTVDDTVVIKSSKTVKTDTEVKTTKNSTTKTSSSKKSKGGRPTIKKDISDLISDYERFSQGEGEYASIDIDEECHVVPIGKVTVSDECVVTPVAKSDNKTKAMEDMGAIADMVKDNNSTINIYTDGSYDVNTCVVGYGVVFTKGDKVLFKTGGSTRSTEDGPRNVLGEIEAVILALRTAIINNYKDICIYYDYAGVEKWVTGEWKAKNKLTKSYVETFNLLSMIVNVSFVKVEGHSGNKFNDMADEIAKAMTKIKGIEQ